MASCAAGIRAKREAIRGREEERAIRSCLPRPAESTVIDLASKADGNGDAAPPTNGLESDAYSGHAAPYDETSVM